MGKTMKTNTSKEASAPKKTRGAKSAAAAKKSEKAAMPEGYIGRPKPMRTKKFEFHKPGVGFYVGLGIFLVVAAFITYIVIRLVSVSTYHQPDFEFYEYDQKNNSKSFTLESDYLKLELDPATTQFTVLQKSTGKVWYSSPVDLDDDPVALAKEKNNMRSSLLIEYSTENGSLDVYDVFSNSVKRSFYNVRKDGNQLVVDYTIGQMNREYIFPPVMYQSDFDKWTENMSKSDINTVNRVYHRYSLSTQTSADDTATLLRNYPEFRHEDLYLVFENVQKFMQEKVEAIFAAAGYTYEDYLESKELYKEDNAKEVPAFNATVIYKLEGNNLVVEVPFDEISFRRAYPITKLSVLPYFGAGNRSAEGFLFIPEGGGSIINFNNGKTRQNSYYADVYGWDYAQDRKSVVTETRIAFPVFGCSNGDSSFISIIENGAAYAGITAEIAGKLGSYNYVRADYKMLHNERYDISARTVNAQYMFEDQLPPGQKIRQIYTFVDSSSYVDMAKAYRNYLFPNEKKLAVSNVPLAIEILGAVDKVQQVAGMPKTLPYTLTTYDEASEIIDELDEMGISDADIKLSGFVNGGIRQRLLNKVKAVRQLGGKSRLKRLIKNSGDSSSRVYLDATMQFAYRSGWSDGFTHYGSPARFVSGKLCELYEYSPVWYGKDDEQDSYYLVKPRIARNASESLISYAAKNGIGVSYRDFGKILSADYNQRALVSREESLQIQAEEFKAAKEKGLGLMVNAGNDYSVRYADFVTGLDLSGNKYAIIDQQVPFYQIALHGYRRFAGNPVNLSAEVQQEVLESAKTGAGLSFTFMKASEMALQDTVFTQYYSASFDSLKDDFYKIYSDYNSKISRVANSCISGFSYLSDSVTSTEFDNGYRVLVNFGYVDFTAEDGTFVPARDYKVVK